jgi:hypothetical protein
MKHGSLRWWANEVDTPGKAARRVPVRGKSRKRCPFKDTGNIKISARLPLQTGTIHCREHPMDLRTLRGTSNQGPETGGASQTDAGAAVRQRAEPAGAPAARENADLYHGADAPVSASLLARSGINAYTQLLSVLASRQLSEHSAVQLTNTLANASVALKMAYYEAVSRLSVDLQQKDWGFSISDGVLVFTGGKDELSAQDLANLRTAFAGADVRPAADKVATAMTSVALKQKSGSDTGSPAWGRTDVDEGNFSDAIDLRAYVTSTVPGSQYNRNIAAPAGHPPIPLTLGMLDLRELVCASPNFLRADGSVRTGEPRRDANGRVELEPVLNGRCLCGGVQFTVENDFEYAYYCHCSRCRARTGSAFAAVAGIQPGKVQIISGREQLLIEGECSDGYGARCNRCYAFLFAAVRDRQYMHVSLGALAGTPNRAPDHHIYVGSKAPWYHISDALPQYNELPETR